MLDFPKQYKQATTSSHIPHSSNKSPFYYLPISYKESFDIGHIFTLSLIDFLYTLRYGQQPYGGLFIKDPFSKAVFDNKNSVSIIKKQLQKFGLSNFSHNIKNSEDSASTFFIQNTFAQYIRKGIIQEDKFLVYWSPKYQTPLSFDDVLCFPKKQNRYDIRYFVSTKNHSLDIPTDSPETIFGDVAIALHPQHKKAKQLKGQEVIIPIINKTIPIIIDERADFTRNGGMYRVTPGHDKLGLAIAKDHGLPTDIYSIDKDGFFTEHAGIFAKKPAEDFFKNIIQSLSDIGNLVNTQTFTGSSPISISTGEHLISRTWKGFFVKIPDTDINNFFTTPLVDSLGVQRQYIDSSYRIASSEYQEGIALPIRYNDKQTSFIIDACRLEQKFHNFENKKGLIFGLFLLHCISTKKIKQQFSADELIELIANNQDPKNFPFENLFSNWKKDYPLYTKEIDELIITIKAFQEENSSLEKIVDEVISCLENSFCVEKTQHSTYRFAFNRLDPEMNDMIQSSQMINQEFISILLLCKEAKDNLDQEKKYPLYAENSAAMQTLRTSIFANHYLGYTPWDSIYFFPTLLNEKEKAQLPVADIKITKNYHTDCIRLSLLLLSQGNHNYLPTIFADQDQAIATFRNACRYIKTNLFGSTDNISLHAIQHKLEKSTQEFSAFDSWILSKLNVLLEEHQQIVSPEDVGTHAKHIFEYIHQDFSGKYLELIKSAPSNHSTNISICIVGILLQLLSIYIPSVTTALWQLIGFKENINKQAVPSIFENIQKNYLISLFMEIIDKLFSLKIDLGLKKHDMVSIFIRSNPDFIKFTKTNEHLLQKSLHTEDICYLVHHEDIPSGYKQEDIIDISIGLKAFGKHLPSGLVQFQKQLQEKEEYLQHLRTMVQHLNTSGADSSVIQQKRDEITAIKDEIERLTFEISKCKMKD